MQTATKTRRHPSARALIAETWQSQANLSLFLVMIVLTGFVLPSVGFGKEDLQRYTSIVFTLLLISGVAIGWGRKTLFLSGAIVATLTLIVRWIAFWKPSPRAVLWSDAFSLAATLTIAIILLAQVFREGPVRSARVQGAIAVYLLFGVAWAHAYHIAATVQPGSFSHSSVTLSNAADWAYFSYVTLSTLGYGDITPLSSIARNLAVGEALTGQLYLAVLIARLVAMELMSSQERTNHGSET